MGDYRFYSTEEAFEDLWLLEDNWAPPPIEKIHINLCQEFGFSPHLEQGISLLEQISSIEDNGQPKQNTSINDDQHLQDSNFSTLGDASDDPIHVFRNNMCTSRVDRDIVDEQLNGSLANSKAGKRSLGKGFRSKTKERKSTNFETDQVVEEDSLVKKQDHNAKERMRRMKLHASFLALGSLLPISRISKVMKRWTAPVVIDKVLDYIPMLESEIEQLNHKKNSILSAIDDQNKQLLLVANHKRMDSKAADREELTVSANEVRQGELILQICRKRDDEAISVFSTLLQKIEDQSIRIVSASTLHVCDERECYNIHIQMNESSSFANGSDYITALKEQFISWLS